MSLPQLRTRSEFSLREGRGIRAFGPLPAIAARLAEIGAPAAGLVDASTWGHTRWAAQCAKTGVAPLFGVEVPVPMPDGTKPLAWVLAGSSSRDLYRLSTAMRVEGAAPRALLRAAAGRLIRFAGAALSDPETFDYIDVNPASARATLAALRLSDKTGKPLVLTSANAYPAPEHRAAYLALGGRDAVTPQHLCSLDELWDALGRYMGGAAFDAAAATTRSIPALCAQKLDTAPILGFTPISNAVEAA